MFCVRVGFRACKRAYVSEIVFTFLVELFIGMKNKVMFHLLIETFKVKKSLGFEKFKDFPHNVSGRVIISDEIRSQS